MRLRLACLLFLAVFPPVLNADGTTLYVNRIVVAASGDLSLGDLLQTSGALPASAQEALSRSIAVMKGSLIYVPAASYSADVDSAFGPGAIVVGQRTTVIPQGSGLETQSWIVDRVIDYLQAQGFLGSGRVEIAVTQVNARGNPPQDGTPVIQAAWNAGGGAEVTFTATGSTGGSISGRLALAASPMAAQAGGQASAQTAAQASTVRQGSPVNVVFRRGLVTIEMPGKALASASAGQHVTVSVAESQKSFSGVVIDGTAVEVDLP